EYLKNPKRYLVYSVPYLIKIEENPILSATFFKTHINDVTDLTFNYINPKIPYQFAVTSFGISRDSIDSDVYTLGLSLGTNLIDEDFDENVKVRGILRSKNGETYGYFDFNRTSGTELNYEGYLAIDRD